MCARMFLHTCLHEPARVRVTFLCKRTKSTVLLLSLSSSSLSLLFRLINWGMKPSELNETNSFVPRSQVEKRPSPPVPCTSMSHRCLSFRPSLSQEVRMMYCPHHNSDKRTFSKTAWTTATETCHVHSAVRPPVSTLPCLQRHARIRTRICARVFLDTCLHAPERIWVTLLSKRTMSTVFLLSSLLFGLINWGMKPSELNETSSFVPRSQLGKLS